QFRRVREDAEKYGMPIIVWSYPRGEAIDAKGGRDSLYAVDYAARVAMELGADIVKINMPKAASEKDQAAPKPYNTMHPTREEAARMVVESAGNALVLFSGGEMQGEGDVIEKARIAMEAGATGLIFGRNVWQRPFEEAIELAKQFRELLSEYSA
ncbi:MAG TPA: hypothetical protein VHI51_04415, partial [Ktedonobacterales bacterium]|nr:hypothetical protein [Ktedonobacterales bacterium]